MILQRLKMQIWLVVLIMLLKLAVLLIILSKVSWDGPNDPANPKNWPYRRRWIATGLVSLITLMTPIASSMIAPAEGQIQQDLVVQSSFDLKLIFSIFLLAFVIGPLFLAPLSELYGRVIVLQLANIVRILYPARVNTS